MVSPPLQQLRARLVECRTGVGLLRPTRLLVGQSNLGGFRGTRDALHIVDESMEPTLADGCAVLVDLRSKSPKDRGIYVILTQDGLVVKRTVLDGKAGWLIVSDNPDNNRFPTQPWGDDAKIMGVVKWHGQSIKVTAEVTRA